MSVSCLNSTDGFGFTRAEIEQTVSRNGLLSMEIEFSLACNFSCSYCYNESAEQDGNELNSGEIKDVILQAKALGARRIIILGGEPMIYPEIHDNIRFIRKNEMEVEMFTNGSCMTFANAKFMYDHDIAVVLKMNSFDPALQNKMAGREDANEIIQVAFDNLTAAGYPAPGKRFAVSTVICNQNIEELPELWRWLRSRGIEPYFEMITPQGRAVGSDWMSPSAARQRELFNELSAIDRAEFGREWVPQPPLVGNVCLRHQFSCLVNAHGTLMPCVGVTVPLGNVRHDSLREILEKSEVLEKLRDFPNNIKGACRECTKSEHCYGCRGAAYQLTGDYLASDPTCWRNQNADIDCLPVDISTFVPQEKPILSVEKLVSVGERRARLQIRVRPDDLFVDTNGVLDETFYIELVAQAIAGLEGFCLPSQERGRHQGLLMSARHFSVHTEVRAGDSLNIDIEKVGRFENCGVIHGTVTRDGEHVADGQISVWKTTEAE